MNTLDQNIRFNARARWLHWVMAALIVLAYVLILSRKEFSRGSDPRLFVVQSHYWVGLVLFVLVFPRLLNRRMNPPPPITPPLEVVMKWASTATHVLLYAFLILQPVLGLLTVLLGKGNLPIPLTGLLIPSPLPVDEALAKQLEGIHKLSGEVFYYVVGLHVVAALFHHCVRKDNTLRRML